MNPDQQSIQNDPAAGRFKYMSGAKPLDGYTIRRGIGIGGFGEVYFAVSDAGKEVALKRIQRNLDIELRGVQNCLNLKHGNLISLWDIRTDQTGESWVVMEYVPGPSLRDIIEVTENGMPGHQIERWFKPIAAGVEYLHDKGIIHRDLKPANIFLDEDENVIKIGDYGLSKFISCSTGSGQTETVGTFHYMAPEIGKGIYGKGIDIYAMGIVLYEMLTGSVPFRGESSQEIIMKHLTADPNLDQVPFDFREAIRRSLVKDPEQRFDSITEMNEYLPWDWDAPGTVLNVDRMAVLASNRGRVNGSIGKTVHKQSRLPDVLSAPIVQDGIQFGPLLDSNAGSYAAGENSDAEIHYIGDSAMVTERALVAANEEPIAQVVRSGWSRFVDWWNDNTVSTPLKVFVLLVAGLVITTNSEWLLPAALGLGFLYLVYYGFRTLVYSSPGEIAKPATMKLNRRQQRRLIHANMRDRLAGQDIVTRSTSLVGSLLTAAIVCISMNLLILAITGSVFDAPFESWALFASSTVVCIAGSWILLVLGKLYEPSDGESLPRRFTMLVAGLLIGGTAFAAGNHLNIDYEKLSSSSFNPLQTSLIVFDGAGPLMASLLFFAAVFGVLRWWRQVDPTRRTRLSIWSVGLCVIVAALFSHVLNFVPFWNCMLVAVISIAIQLSAPWIPRIQRQAYLKSELNATV